MEPQQSNTTDYLNVENTVRIYCRKQRISTFDDCLANKIGKGGSNAWLPSTTQTYTVIQTNKISSVSAALPKNISDYQSYLRSKSFEWTQMISK